MGIQRPQGSDSVVGWGGSDQVADDRAPVAQLGSADLPAGQCQRETPLDQQPGGRDLVVRDRRADVDQALIIEVDSIQASDAGDVDQRARLADAAPQLDQQVGATGDDARLWAMLGQQAQSLIKRSRRIVGCPHATVPYLCPA